MSNQAPETTSITNGVETSEADFTTQRTPWAHRPHSRWQLVTAAAIAVVALVLLVIRDAQLDGEQDHSRDATHELGQARDDLAAVRTDRDNLKSEVADLREQLETSNDQLAKTSRALRNTNRILDDQQKQQRAHEAEAARADAQVTVLVRQAMNPTRCVSAAQVQRELDNAAGMSGQAQGPQFTTNDKPVSCLTRSELKFRIAEALANSGLQWMSSDTEQMFTPSGRAVPNVSGRPLPNWLFVDTGGPYVLYGIISDGYPVLAAMQVGYIR